MKYIHLSDAAVAISEQHADTFYEKNLLESIRRANALAEAVKAYRDRIETDAFEPLELDNAVDQALSAYLGEGPDSEGSP